MNNIQHIKKQIELKKGYTPFFGTIDDAVKCITDADHFPYTRYYRGVYNRDTPGVYERDAGWRPIQHRCNNKIVSIKYPDHCFEAPCSTVYPCKPSIRNKSYHHDINDSCIVQYR